MMTDAFMRVPVRRIGRAEAVRSSEPRDSVVIEEPLEVRLHGKPFAVIMRTPGADRELAAGFLFSEGVVSSGADLGAIEHCRHPHHPEFHNIVDVFLLGEAAASLEDRLRERRNVLATSSCGLCGRVAIESLELRAAPLRDAWAMASQVAASLPDRLRRRQPGFEETGGIHAAALFDAEGGCIAAAEDVGRHNAVDKIVGELLMAERLPASRCALVVSGRASFEIVQKAWLAGIPVICAVSAPSSLAIELAQTAGITLLGFARNGGFNIYSHHERIET